MHPIIFHFGILTVYSYGVMLGAAVVVCALLLSYDAKKQGISRDVVFDFAFWVVLAGIAGARIFYIFLNWDIFTQNPKEKRCSEENFKPGLCKRKNEKSA